MVPLCYTGNFVVFSSNTATMIFEAMLKHYDFWPASQQYRAVNTQPATWERRVMNSQQAAAPAAWDAVKGMR